MTIDAKALDQIFLKARTANGFIDKPVPDELLRQVYDIARMGPTSMNTQPTRYVFLKTAEARARLLPALTPGNLDKTRSAPVTVIVATLAVVMGMIAVVVGTATQAHQEWDQDDERETHGGTPCPNG